MSKRCFDILDLPFLSDIKLVAGEGGVEHSIFWVHIAESADSEAELITLCKPDDFLIIKGSFLANLPNGMEDMIKMAINQKLSGLLLIKSELCSEVPQTVIDLANEYDIPIFFLEEPSIIAVEIQYYMTHMIAHDNNSHMLDKIMKDIVYGSVENAQLRIKRANFMGYNLDRKHSGVSIKMFTKELKPVNINHRIESICYELMHEYNKESPLYIIQENAVIALLPWLISTNKNIVLLCQRIIAQIHKADSEINVVIGIGQGKSDVNLFKASTVEAGEITDVMTAQNKFNMVSTYCDMYSNLLLYQMKDKPIAIDMCHKILDPIRDYDYHHNTSLMLVFKTYLEESKNAVKTAKRLFVHRNTLLYQINKIEELTELSFNDTDDEFKMRMVLYLYEIIESESKKTSRT